MADENVKVMHTLVMCDRMRDLRIIASEVGISFGAIRALDKLLGQFGIYATWSSSAFLKYQTSGFFCT